MAECQIDSDCPFLFYCTEDLQCIHDPIFPLQFYPIIIYALLPIAVGLVNMTGNSMGVFKVLLFVNALRYQNSQATFFVQPAVAGAGLPNFFNIIFKKHPKRESPLVDYNILYIMIPCCLLGSTLGSFIQKFIPEIVQDVIVMIFFGYFTKQFLNKLKVIKQKQSELTQTMITNGKNQNEQRDSQSSTNQVNIQEAIPNSYADQNTHGQSLTEQQLNSKDQLVAYESSMRVLDILISFTVFFVFEFFVFLVQGKFAFYQIKVCSIDYGLGITFLILMTVGYLFFIRKQLNKRYVLYKKLDIPFNLDLSIKKTFIMIAIGGGLAGFFQGILGVGSGTFIMGILLAYNIDPRVASATSGYQVFFIGAASFTESFVTGDVSLKDAGFLFLICSVLGGLVTFGFYYYLKTKNQLFVNKILIIVICALCIISVVGMVPYIIQTWIDFGWEEMIRIKFHC